MELRAGFLVAVLASVLVLARRGFGFACFNQGVSQGRRVGGRSRVTARRGGSGCRTHCNIHSGSAWCMVWSAFPKEGCFCYWCPALSLPLLPTTSPLATRHTYITQQKLRRCLCLFFCLRGLRGDLMHIASCPFERSKKWRPPLSIIYKEGHHDT